MSHHQEMEAQKERAITGEAVHLQTCAVILVLSCGISDFMGKRKSQMGDKENPT